MLWNSCDDCGMSDFSEVEIKAVYRVISERRDMRHFLPKNNHSERWTFLACHSYLG
jgi:hypothetical protein